MFFLVLTAFIVFSAKVDSMPLILVNALVLFFEKAICNGSATVSVVAECFLEVELSREVVVNESNEELPCANIW